MNDKMLCSVDFGYKHEYLVVLLKSQLVQTVVFVMCCVPGGAMTERESFIQHKCNNPLNSFKLYVGYGVMRTNKTEADEIYEGGYDGNMKHGVGVMKYA